MDRRTLILSALAAVTLPSTAALAGPQRYGIGAKGASIKYTFSLNGGAVTGTVPLSRADLRIDPANLAASTADVTADIRRAKTGLVFATQALKAPSGLDAARFPEARFVSTRVRLGPGGRLSNGARLDGNLTLRGVTLPIQLKADLFRPRGASADDLSRLNVQLTGTLSRSAFGMTAYPEIVADRVGLAITADIQSKG